MQKKELKKYKYIVYTLRDGSMIKRYYYEIKDSKGCLHKKFFYAKRAAPSWKPPDLFLLTPG